MTPRTPAPPEANHPSRRPRAQSLPDRPNHRSPLPPPVPDERRSHISPRQGLTPCSPLRRRPTAPNAVPAPGGDPLDPRSAGHPAKKNAVPASRRMSTVLAGGRDGLPRPRSAGRPPKTIALPAPGGDPLDPRSAGHPAKKNAVPASRRMSTVLAGGRDGLPRPRSAGRPPKTIALPAPGGDPLDPRSAGHPAKKNAVPASRRMSTVLAGGRDGLPRPRSAGHPAKKNAVPASRRMSAVLAGGRDGLPRPRSAGHPAKKTPSPRPGVCQPSPRGRNRPFRGRLSHGYPCFPMIQPLFPDKIPQPWTLVPGAAFF